MEHLGMFLGEGNRGFEEYSDSFFSNQSIAVCMSLTAFSGEVQPEGVQVYKNAVNLTLARPEGYIPDVISAPFHSIYFITVPKKESRYLNVYCDTEQLFDTQTVSYTDGLVLNQGRDEKFPFPEAIVIKNTKQLARYTEQLMNFSNSDYGVELNRLCIDALTKDRQSEEYFSKYKTVYYYKFNYGGRTTSAAFENLSFQGGSVTIDVKLHTNKITPMYQAYGNPEEDDNALLWLYQYRNRYGLCVYAVDIPRTISAGTSEASINLETIEKAIPPFKFTEIKTDMTARQYKENDFLCFNRYTALSSEELDKVKAKLVSDCGYDSHELERLFDERSGRDYFSEYTTMYVLVTMRAGDSMHLAMLDFASVFWDDWDENGNIIGGGHENAPVIGTDNRSLTLEDIQASPFSSKLIAIDIPRAYVKADKFDNLEHFSGGVVFGDYDDFYNLKK